MVKRRSIDGVTNMVIVYHVVIGHVVGVSTAIKGHSHVRSSEYDDCDCRGAVRQKVEAPRGTGPNGGLDSENEKPLLMCP